MKFKLDENLPRRAAQVILERGHDAVMLLDQVDAGVSDSRVAELVRSEGRVLISLDLDFADIRTYPPEEHPGIVILRPRSGDAKSVLTLVERTLGAIDLEPLGSPLGCRGRAHSNTR